MLFRSSLPSSTKKKVGNPLTKLSLSAHACAILEEAIIGNIKFVCNYFEFEPVVQEDNVV